MTEGCRARLNDCDAEPAVAGLARAATFVEFEPQARIEGEIQQMPSDYPVTEFCRVMRGDAAGRADARGRPRNPVPRPSMSALITAMLIAGLQRRDMALERTRRVYQMRAHTPRGFLAIAAHDRIQNVPMLLE